MTIKLYTILKDRIGASRVEIEASTAAEAIDTLRAKYTDIVNATLVDANGVVRNHFTLTLNSQILDPLKLKDVPLKDGDLLHIFPPIAGGASLPLAVIASDRRERGNPALVEKQAGLLRRQTSRNDRLKRSRGN